MARVRKSAVARRDLIEQIAFYIENAGHDTASRFADAAEQTFQELLRMPRMGSPHPVPEDSSIRCLRIRGFERHLIFYRAVSSDIEIVRVLHSARNISRILADR